MTKTLKEIHEDVPPEHYDKGIKKNIFQNYWHNRRFKEITKRVDLGSTVILDVGCHSGLFTQYIFKASKAQIVYGIDVSPKSIAWAKKRIKKGKFRVGNAHNLPYKNEFFDAVFCMEMLEHVEDPKKVILEIKRVLKKGGYGMILVPTDNFLFRITWFIWNYFKPVWKHAHVQSFRASSLEELILKLKFRILDTTEFNLGMLKIVKFRKV